MLNSGANQAMHSLMKRMDASGIITEEGSRFQRSEGAGVGFNTGDAEPGLIGRSQYRFPQAERGKMERYGFSMLLIATQYARKEAVEFVIWDLERKTGIV